jgi:hypothetical protein
MFKATYNQNNFSLNQKADAGEALNFILETLHSKLDRWRDQAECMCEVHLATHCSTSFITRCN